MSDPDSGLPVPPAVPIAPSAPWGLIVGAVFGALTFIGLFILINQAAQDDGFLCKTHGLVAALFSIGAALSAGFIGGSAAINGQLGSAAQQNSLAYSAGGGIAVLLIVFAMFQFYKPDAASCQRTDAELRLDEIPTTLSHAPLKQLWFRRDGEKEKLLNTYQLNILLQPWSRQEDLSLFVPADAKIDGVDRPQPCTLAIHPFKELEDQFSNYELTQMKLSSFGGVIPLKYKAALGQGGTKASSPVCFYLKGKPVFGMIAVSLSRDMLIYAKGNKSGEVEEAALPLTPERAPPGWLKAATIWLQPIGEAVAGPSLPEFSELALQLDWGDNLSVGARQFLSDNFDAYSEPAVAWLLSPDPARPQVTAGVLHGLIAGIDSKTNGALSPGRKRNLAEKLPYIGGHERSVVALTGDPNEAVKRQARRLVQRYPMDAFAAIYQPMVQAAASGACDVGPNPQASQAILYSSIFFFHNRIVQKNYAATLPEADAAEADEIARLVKAAAAACLPPNLQVDAALIDFGRAIIYSEADGGAGTYKVKSKAAASDFLDSVKGREDTYYYSTHIDRMKALVTP